MAFCKKREEVKRNSTKGKIYIKANLVVEKYSKARESSRIEI